MNKMSVTAAATIFIVVAAIILLFRGGADLCPNATVSKIRRIKLEMPERDVRAILGEPFAAAPNQHQPNMITMNYSRKAKWVEHFPMLWVHLSNHVVVQAYAAEYCMWGNLNGAAYGLSKDQSFESPQFPKLFPP